MYPNTDQMMVWAIFFFSHDQDKVVQYKEKCQGMEARLNEVNELSNQSRAQLGDSADVLRGLEAKLRHTEVNRQILPHFFKPIMQSIRIFGGTLWDMQATCLHCYPIFFPCFDLNKQLCARAGHNQTAPLKDITQKNTIGTNKYWLRRWVPGERHVGGKRYHELAAASGSFDPRLRRNKKPLGWRNMFAMLQAPNDWKRHFEVFMALYKYRLD